MNGKKLGLFIVLQMLMFLNGTKGEELHDRDYHGYHPPDYQPIHYYPPNYHEEPTFIENYPVPALMNKGFNFLAIKLGVLGIVKGVVILLFSLFVLKLPILLFKMLLVKSLFLPVVGIPLLMYYYMNYFNQYDTSPPPTQPQIITVQPVLSTPSVPVVATTTTTTAAPTPTPTNGSRSFEYADPMFLTWESIKMFAENDQCLERIYCSIGATHERSYLGTILYRALKFLNDTTSPGTEGRIPSLMKAYGKGKKTQKCTTNDFKCQTPEIVLQQGLKKLKVL